MSISRRHPHSEAESSDAPADYLRRWWREWRRRMSRGPALPKAEWPTDRLAEQWAHTVGMMLRFRNASAGNLVRVHCEGDLAMEAIWNAIADAKRRIWVEVYTIADDRVGRRTIEHLLAATTRGCEVILVIDAVGSKGMTDAQLAPLREAGATVVIYNPIGWNRAWLRRDHRKIITIDDEIGFCGGMNLSEDYAGAKWGNGYFQDCHLALRGPCVADLVRVQRYALSDMHLPGPRRARPSPKAGDSFVQILESDGRMEKREIQRAMRLAVRRTVRRCWVTTPYFVPPMRLIRSFNHAAERGVDVRLMTAGRSDVPIVSRAARHVYPLLLKNGVRIFEVTDVILHAKTVVMDGLFSMVGSFNLDQWSEFRNLEVKAAILDPAVAQNLEQRFESMLPRCREITLKMLEGRSLWGRFIDWAAYLLMRL